MARNVTVRLTDEQVEILTKLSVVTKESVSKIVRDAVWRYISQESDAIDRLTSEQQHTLGEAMEILNTEEIHEELREASREAEEARDAGNVITGEELLAEQTGPLVVVSTTDMAYHTLQVFDAMLTAKPGTMFLLFNQKGLQAGFRKMADDDAGQVWEALRSDAQTITQLYRRGPQGPDGC